MGVRDDKGGKTIARNNHSFTMIAYGLSRVRAYRPTPFCPTGLGVLRCRVARVKGVGRIARPAQAVSFSMADFTRLTVLLVENNPYVRALIREMLAAFGVRRIAEAGTVVDAVRIVDKVPLDLVILDFFLDRMDGADFTRMVRQNESVSNRQVPILLLTALPNQAKIAKMRDCGVNVIVTKPVAPRTLFNHIREIMDRPREFIVCDSYVGPCRRRRQMDVPPALDRRRRRHEPSPVEHDRMVGSPAG